MVQCRDLSPLVERLGGDCLRREYRGILQRGHGHRAAIRQTGFLMTLKFALIAISIALLCGSAERAGAEGETIADFSHADTGWFPVGDDFLPPISGPGPVVSDPAHPYYSNQSGRQPTDRVADLKNPI